METAVASVDTLMTLLTSFKNDSATIAKIYELSGYAYSGVFFSATTSTMQQLKNSGSLRYFRDKDLVRLFSQYDTDLQRPGRRSRKERIPERRNKKIPDKVP